ncbi:MAG: AAA family ATPase [Armatimonadetes bacterium]|nr:AAA family ATPase [Armatimonadota bacterium]
MKVSIQNLGAIKQAEIEIKPLTVFVGENGTGKTWAAYSLAGILGRSGLTNFCESYTLQPLSTPRFPEIDEAIQRLVKEGSARINMALFAESRLLDYLNAVSKNALQGLPVFLGTPSSDFGKTQLLFDDLDMKLVVENLKRLSINLGWAVGSYSDPKFSTRKESGNIYLDFVTVSMEKGSVFSESRIREIVIQMVFMTLHWSVYANAACFPVERTMIIQMPNPPSSIEYTDSREDVLPLTLQKEARHILSQSLKIVSEGGDRKALQDIDKQDYVPLSQLLEKDILRGSVSYKQILLNAWELYYNFGEGRSLELRAASSMVKELALLVLYLRYLAQKNDVIVIDEPEMNLHPEAQARMTEFLCMMVNAGLNVIVTTHSSYIVDHLANLLKAAKSSDKAELAERFFLKDERAFIAQDKVSVYHFENGSAHSILDEDGYIDWQTFSDVSERMLRLADIVEDYQGAVV